MIKGNKTTHKTKQQCEQDLEGVKEQLAHLKTTRKRTMASSNGNGAQQKQMKELHTQIAPLLTLICLHKYYMTLIFYMGSCKYICIFFTLPVCKCKC